MFLYISFVNTAKDTMRETGHYKCG